MKTKGRRIIEETVDVDVDTGEILGNIYNKWVPKGLDHIGSDGYWYKKDGFDYHKREDLYARDREPTPEELEFVKAYRLLCRFVKENEL